MTAHSFHDERPFSVRQLADRWECSESMVRKLVKTNRLRPFWIGELMRFSASEVGRYEACQMTLGQSSDSGEGSPSSGMTEESADDANSPPRIGRARRRRPPPSGKAQTIVHGPWGAS